MTDRSEVRETGRVVGTWLKDSGLRAIGVRSGAESVAWTGKDDTRLWGFLGGIVFPLTTGIHQRRLGERWLLGGLLELTAIGIDLLSLPTLHLLRPLYNFAAAAATERLGPRKKRSPASRRRG